MTSSPSSKGSDGVGDKGADIEEKVAIGGQTAFEEMKANGTLSGYMKPDMHPDIIPGKLADIEEKVGRFSIHEHSSQRRSSPYDGRSKNNIHVSKIDITTSSLDV